MFKKFDGDIVVLIMKISIIMIMMIIVMLMMINTEKLEALEDYLKGLIEIISNQ